MEDVRSGQWTPQEICYATRLIEEFRKGSLQIPEGTSMRGFLAEKLCCGPKRVSKKYENSNYNGRLLYVPDKTLSAEVCVRTRLEVEKLERLFHESVHEAKTAKAALKLQEKERKQKANAPSSVSHAETKTAKSKVEHSVAAASTVNNALGLRTSVGAQSNLIQASNQLQAMHDLEKALERKAAAASASNDKILSILAARPRLAQQNLRANLVHEVSAMNSTRNNQFMPPFATLRRPQAQLPPSQNTIASQVERLRFLRQIELENQQRLLSPAATAPSSSVRDNQMPSLSAASLVGKRWDASIFQEQARSLALSNAERRKISLLATKPPAGVNWESFQQRPPSSMPSLSPGRVERLVTSSGLKRKQPPTESVPPPKRSRLQS